MQDDRTSVTVTVLGEVDLASRAALDSCLNEALTVGVNAVLVELSGLSFIDLTGMRTILEFERECRRRGVEPRLVSSSGVDKALDIGEPRRMAVRVPEYESDASSPLVVEG